MTRLDACLLLATTLLSPLAAARDGGPEIRGPESRGLEGEDIKDAGPEDAAPSLASQSRVRKLLDEFLAQTASEALQRAQQQIVEGRLIEARELLRDAVEMDPNAIEIWTQLARVEDQLGASERAVEALRAGLGHQPLDHDALLFLCDLLLQRGDDRASLDELAQDLAALALAQPASNSVVVHQARLAAALGQVEQAEKFYLRAAEGEPSDGALHMEIGDFFRSQDHLEQAISWYSRDLDIAELEETARQRIFATQVQQQAQRYGWVSPSRPPDAQLLTQLDRGRELIRQRRPAQAVRILGEVVQQAPAYGEARLALGDALRQSGHRDEAELTYLRGLAVDQGTAALYARLGELYLQHPRPSRLADAVLFLRRALELRPDWAEVQLQLAQALRRKGDLPQALSAVRRYLASDPPEHDRPRALALARNLESLLQDLDPPLAEGASSPRPHFSAAINQLNLARALLARGDSSAALTALQQALAEGRGPEVRLLEARILHAAGQYEQAALSFEAVLAAKPERADVHCQLALVLEASGQPLAARRHLLKAEELGDPEATFHLARLSLSQIGTTALSVLRHPLELLDARARLRATLASPSASVHHGEAQTMLDGIDRGISSLALPLSLGSLLLFTLLFWLLRQKRARVDLATLVRQQPQLGPDVQQILSSIRHEVLKHNTLLIEATLRDLDAGAEPKEQARRIQKLVAKNASPPSPADRFASYLRALEQLAARAGLRLAWKREPALISVARGFSRARRASAAGRLDRKILQHAHRLLNVDACQRLEEILLRLRRVDIDHRLVQGCLDRVCAEPQLRDLKISPLRFVDPDLLPLALAIPRSDLEDVLCNLLRNALLVAKQEGQRPIDVGFAARRQIHAITGLSFIILSVLDRCQANIDDQLIAGQPVERGLGLVRSIVTRNGGRVRVGSAPSPWSKAIEIVLPDQAMDPGSEGE